MAHRPAWVWFGGTWCRAVIQGRARGADLGPTRDPTAWYGYAMVSTERGFTYVEWIHQDHVTVAPAGESLPKEPPHESPPV